MKVKMPLFSHSLKAGFKRLAAGVSFELDMFTFTMTVELFFFTYEVILGMGLGGLIVLLLTGSWKAVTVITLTYTAVKLVMYFIYDKIWKGIKWGTTNE